MGDHKHMPSRYGFSAALFDDNVGSSCVETYLRNQDSATSGTPATARRDSQPREGARTPMQGRVQVQYLLKAWSEGHYARVAHSQSGTCPYPEESDMARAWEQGWQFGCEQDALTG